MEVTSHPDERLVVISLWHGSTCRATFRLPVEEAPGVISALAGALGEAAGAGPVAKHAPAVTLVERLLRRLHQESAEIINLAKHRPK